jgi:hypothetical protein
VKKSKFRSVQGKNSTGEASRNVEVRESSQSHDVRFREFEETMRSENHLKAMRPDLEIVELTMRSENHLEVMKPDLESSN